MNLNFKSGVGKLLHWVGYFLVFGFTATCTYMLFQSITPPGLWWIPILALGFIEYGALKWKTYHKEVAEDVLQHVISLALLFICIVAIVGTVTLEVTKWFAGAGYLTTMPWIIMLTVYYLIFTIAVNVLAYMTIDLLHPSHMGKLSALGSTSLPSSGHTRVVEANPQHMPGALPPQQSQGALPAPQEQTFTRAHVQQMIDESMQRHSSPLQQPQVETKQASHEGNQNGKQ